MPNYRPLAVDGSGRGLNLTERADKLLPGEAVEAFNVHFHNRSIQKRRGMAPVFKGGLDEVLRGGPPAPSLAVQGHQYWLEHEYTVNGLSGAHQYRDDEYHHRQGLIVIPEAQVPALRLDPAGDEWALEMILWADELPGPLEISGSPFLLPTVVMAKSYGTETQWDVRLIPVDAAFGTSSKFYIALTLYHNEAHGSGTEFYFLSGAERSWFEVGKRHWVGWRLVSGSVIESYYRREGQLTVSRSQQSAAGITRGTDNWPVTIGRRPRIITASDIRDELGFNGVVADMRFWEAQAGNPLRLVDWETDWAWDRELTGDEVSSYSFNQDLRLYYSMAPRYVVEGQAHLLEPRYPNDRDEHSPPDPEASRAWLTGADATWAVATPPLGKSGLSFVPSVGVAGQEEAFSQVPGEAREVFGAGVRIPNGHLYLNRDQDESAPGTGRVWPGEFTVRVSFQPDLFVDGGTDETLIQFCAVLRGTGDSSLWHYYRVKEQLWLGMVWDTNRWVVRALLRHSAGVTTITGTTAIAENARYVAAVMVRDSAGATDRTVALYLNGVEEARASVAVGPMLPSTTTSSDTDEPNRNHEDGRDNVYPIFLGCRVDTDDTATPTDYLFRVGAWQRVGYTGSGIAPEGNPRLRWGFHHNQTRHLPNDGVGFRGWNVWRGIIGDAQVWSRALTDAEVRRFASRAPSEQEIASYGADLRSHWDFEEGGGSLLFDKGHVGNHIPLNPLPQVRSIAGPIARRDIPPIRGFWEHRTSTLREGLRERRLFALSSGSVSKLERDLGNAFMRPISGRVHDGRDVLPTAFSFSDYTYICPGLGPVLRVSRGKVTQAGISPAQGVDQGDHLGWAECDRDGTFATVQNQADTPEEVVFALNGRWQWLVTWYDAEAAVESVGSRVCTYIVEDVNSTFGAGNGNGASFMRLRLLPRPRERNVSHYRIYRTAKDVDGVFYFVDEIPSDQHLYIDRKSDDELGALYSASFHFPPPKSCNIGVSNGRRAIYLGSQEFPGTAFVSLLGFPEYVPPDYQVTPTPMNSNELTGAVSFHARTLIFFQDATYVLNDQGADKVPGGAATIPFTLEVLWNDVGAICHHGIVLIDTIGAVFPGERGLYVTDGASFRYISDRVEPFWAALDHRTRRKWHAVHHRQHNQYIIFCASKNGAGRNDVALVWDYKNDAFSIWGGFEAAFSQVIEDPQTGLNRLYISDYMGGLWELDPPDRELADDCASGSGAELLGTIAEVDPNNPLTCFALYPAGEGNLPTQANGLRGCPCTIRDPFGGCVRARIAWNDSRWICLERPLSTAPQVGYIWLLGSVEARWRSGLMNLGDDRYRKGCQHVGINWEPRVGATADLEFNWDENQVQSKALMRASSPRSQVRFPGRGRRLQIAVGDIDPRSRWEVAEFDIGWLPKGDSRWRK